MAYAFHTQSTYNHNHHKHTYPSQCFIKLIIDTHNTSTSITVFFRRNVKCTRHTIPGFRTHTQHGIIWIWLNYGYERSTGKIAQSQIMDTKAKGRWVDGSITPSDPHISGVSKRPLTTTGYVLRNIFALVRRTIITKLQFIIKNVYNKAIFCCSNNRRRGWESESECRSSFLAACADRLQQLIDI